MGDDPICIPMGNDPIIMMEKISSTRRVHACTRRVHASQNLAASPAMNALRAGAFVLWDEATVTVPQSADLQAPVGQLKRTTPRRVETMRAALKTSWPYLVRLTLFMIRS